MSHTFINFYYRLIGATLQPTPSHLAGVQTEICGGTSKLIKKESCLCNHSNVWSASLATESTVKSYQTVRCLTLFKGKRFICFSKRQEKLRGPTCLLFNNYWEPLPQNQSERGMKLTTHLHTERRLRIREAITSFPMCLHNAHNDIDLTLH